MLSFMLHVHVFLYNMCELLTERKAPFGLCSGNYGREWLCMHPISHSWHQELEKCVNTQAANPPMLTIQGNKKSKFLFTLIHSAVLTRSKICFSLFMIECNVIFWGRKIHSKTLKHCFIKSITGNVPRFSGQVSAAWHIFGSLMDNGAKHKFWHVIFPV